MAHGRGEAERDGPLAGLRVLDLGRVWAGPFAGRLLADLGADVVWLEAPDARGGRTVPPGLGAVTHLFPDGEPGREPWNRIGSVNALGRNRRGVALDLSRAEARPAFAALVAAADVLLDNFAPDVLPRLGFDAERLFACNRELIWTSISGYGASGPESSRVAFGPLLEARLGVTRATGYRDSFLICLRHRNSAALDLPPREFIGVVTKSRCRSVMPAAAGIHPGSLQIATPKMDSGLRRNHEESGRLTLALYSYPSGGEFQLSHEEPQRPCLA